MMWSLWFLAPDIWLIYQIPSYWALIMAVFSGLVNVVISLGVFFLLVYAIKRLVERWPDRQFFMAVANQFKVFLARSQAKGYRIAKYIEEIRIHKYLFLYLLNVIPFIPWVTGGTVCYTAVTKNFWSLLYIILGLVTKVTAITIVAFLIRT